MVESFEAAIETRSISDENAVPIFMTRGAGRTFTLKPFKMTHVKEFLGTRQEGTLKMSIAYGDVEGPPTRRLKMSFTTYYEFPNEQAISSGVPFVTLGFNHTITKESDEPIKSEIG